MTLLPNTPMSLAHFRPALPRRQGTTQALNPELAARLHDLAERNILEAARLRLQRLGQPVTDAALDAERKEMAELREKYAL